MFLVLLVVPLSPQLLCPLTPEVLAGFLELGIVCEAEVVLVVVRLVDYPGNGYGAAVLSLSGGPVLGGGLGQYSVDWDAEDRRRSIWSAVLEGGFELSLGRRWLIELALHNRSIEFSRDSFSGSSLILTFGTRLDA